MNLKNSDNVAASDKGKPLTLRKRIGSTVYTVTVHFNEKSKESLEDKILRLIEREVNNNA